MRVPERWLPTQLTLSSDLTKSEEFLDEKGITFPSLAPVRLVSCSAYAGVSVEVNSPVSGSKVVQLNKEIFRISCGVSFMAIAMLLVSSAGLAQTLSTDSDSPAAAR